MVGDNERSEREVVDSMNRRSANIRLAEIGGSNHENLLIRANLELLKVLREKLDG